jgi:flagellar FliJ protein
MSKFKLESLLQHRKRIEETYQRQLAEIRLVLQEEKDVLARLNSNRDRIKLNLEQRLTEDINAAEMLHFNKYLDRLSLDISLQKKRVAEVEENLKNKRLKLTEAVKRRKIMDKLKDKQLAAECEKIEKNEQNFMNEIAINRHLRFRE